VHCASEEFYNTYVQYDLDTQIINLVIQWNVPFATFLKLFWTKLSLLKAVPWLGRLVSGLSARKPRSAPVYAQFSSWPILAVTQTSSQYFVSPLMIPIPQKWPVSLFYYPRLVQWAIYDLSNRGLLFHPTLRKEKHKAYTTGEVIPYPPWNPKDHCRVQKCLPLDTISSSQSVSSDTISVFLSLVISIGYNIHSSGTKHIIWPWFYKHRFNFIPSSRSCSPNQLFPITCFYYTFVGISYFHHAL
jgi:hypothetical protein